MICGAPGNGARSGVLGRADEQPAARPAHDDEGGPHLLGGRHRRLPVRLRHRRDQRGRRRDRGSASSSAASSSASRSPAPCSAPPSAPGSRGPFADRVGRIRVMLIAATLFAISALGSGLAFGVWDLIFWRLVGGLGVGAASVIAPAYIAEVAPSNVRGRLGSLQQLAIVLGIFVALLSDAFIANVAGGAAEESWFGLEAWRWMFLAELVPAVVYGVLVAAGPGVAALPGRQGASEAGGRSAPGRARREEHRAVQQSAQITGPACGREHDPSLRDLLGNRFGLLPIVWVGHPAVGVPAVRRHQRDLLLLDVAVALGRLRGERRPDHHGDHFGDQRRGDTRRDRHRRQGRPQAAARSSARPAWLVRWA